MSIFCSNPGVDKGILEPQRLAESFTRENTTRKNTFRKNKNNAVAPLPASSVDDTTDRIVEDIPMTRGAIPGPELREVDSSGA